MQVLSPRAGAPLQKCPCRSRGIALMLVGDVQSWQAQQRSELLHLCGKRCLCINHAGRRKLFDLRVRFRGMQVRLLWRSRTSTPIPPIDIELYMLLAETTLLATSGWL